MKNICDKQEHTPLAALIAPLSATDIVQSQWNCESRPNLDAMYASQLKQQCPQGNTNPNLVVPMDPSSPAITDAGYFTNILANRGLFTSDQTLVTNTAAANQVNQSKRNPLLWRSKFAAAMVKMGQLDVLTGNVGEIRSNCRVINS